MGSPNHEFHQREFPQPLHENNKAKIASHHHVLLLVFLYEGVPDLASFVVHLGAHGVRSASQTWVFPAKANLAPGGWFVFNQPLLDQIIPICFIDVQAKSRDATFEKATPLFTVFGKAGMLLVN